MNHNALQIAVQTAKMLLETAESELKMFESTPEFHTYPDMSTAWNEMQRLLRTRMGGDCENNYGEPVYTQEFIVGSKHFMANLACEYSMNASGDELLLDSANLTITEKE